MKSCRNVVSPLLKYSVPGLLIAMICTAGAKAALPNWILNIEAGSLVESAIFRAMNLPGGPVLVRRPPSETVPALSDLVRSTPNNAELYSLRALENEQKLDFTAAEADWKSSLQFASDKASAQIALADFYNRRLRPVDEVNALSAAGQMPASPSEKLTPPAEQRSWRAFERIFTVVQSQALGSTVSVAQYKAWIERYPQEGGLYGRYFEYLLAQKDYKSAGQLIVAYQKAFPADEIFPVKARALLDYRQRAVEAGLAVYDKSFQPLWPAELVKNYFDLLTETRRTRNFLDRQRAALVANPDDLNAVTRIFYYYQQKGDLAAAQQTLTEYRLHKDARNANWTAQELYTFARLLEAVHAYPEAARYYYALYNSNGMADGPEQALSGITDILLTAPEQPIRLGSADLSMYTDIANLDMGPGYLNGILSLILNSTSPAANFAEEERRAVPYFHRSRAAELVSLFDKRFPNSAQRPELHSKLIEAYANYGQSEAVIRTGQDFLKDFPTAERRTAVALLMADAFARTDKVQEEFAIYDAVLQELARKSDGIPLGDRADASNPSSYQVQPNPNTAEAGEGEAESEGDEGGEAAQRSKQAKTAAQQRAFSVGTGPASVQTGPRSPEYARVLDRYVSRLVSRKDIPQALTVLRREIDRNPNDPGLYEHLAAFLEQNQIGAEQEALYRRAIQQFPDKTWYHKLARWYLRKQRNDDFERLSAEVVKIFSGSDLESYLQDVGGGPQATYLRINQYANKRFPHNPTFVRNLLNEYKDGTFRNEPAWEALIRQHWFEDDGLRSEFFEYLSHKGRLSLELESLKQADSGAHKNDWETTAKANPAEVRFIAEAELWQSHFESAAPMLAAVANQYPADPDIGSRASSVYRSLAYFVPKYTDAAVRIENNLLKSDPANRERLARIGDIYADRELFEQAAPYWNRMPSTAPGEAGSYLEAATVFWDYYDFDHALLLLNQGRKKLGNDSLYSYEAGAVYENRRDYAHAIEEYVNGALAGDESSPARSRLLQLATRPAHAPLVDAAITKAVNKADTDLTAINLRIAVLEAQNRKEEVAKVLTSLVERSNSVEMLESLEAIARDKSLESVRQLALERQAALTSDPIRRLELRYSLVRFYEGKKDIEAAQRNVEALYNENPKILGVVRATVDFYSRNKMPQRAIDVLLQAAKDSYPTLAAQFKFEAARKITDAGGYEPARKLLIPLLGDSPLNGEYLAAIADTYARAGDNAGLRDFYLAKIDFFRKTTMSEDERKNRIAALRRGLIPALTMLKDYAGAVDQYIEIINRFPDDPTLTTEAAFYTQRYNRKSQLVSFYAKTIADSPKDSRWAIVLGRLQTDYEDFPAAIETYSKAIRIRPDRLDLISARATLEERLLRFDEAAADYSIIYELSYRDAKWMEKVGEVRARQRKTDLVIAALNTAFIDGRPKRATNYFEAAKRLESWEMLPQARDYAQQGVDFAGRDLLVNSEYHSGAQLYARVMSRLRQQGVAYQRLQVALQASTEAPSMIQQVEMNGLAAVTDRELRQNLLRTRIATGRGGMTASLREMGSVVDRYFTPEEKQAFSLWVETLHSGMSEKDVVDFLLPVAETAVLPDQEAQWRYAILSRTPHNMPDNRFEELQRRRLKLNDLAGQLEKLADRTSIYQQLGYLERSCSAYHSAGDDAGELRLLKKIASRSTLGGAQQQRYFKLLLESEPQSLVKVAGSNTTAGDASANFIIGNSDARLALSAVSARSTNLPPVWAKAYTGIVGLYFADQNPQIQAAFRDALVDETIGQKLGKQVDRSQHLAGDVWYYYGSRYGEYLGVTKKGDPEDFLPAVLEQSPGRASAYFITAQYYEDAGDLPRAIADYEHVLELSPSRVDAHNRLALIYWRQKNTAKATAEWTSVLDILDSQVRMRSVPETFWQDYAVTIDYLATRHIFPQFRSKAASIIATYIKKNGNYRLKPLLRSTLNAANASGSVSEWILDLSSNASDKFTFLTDLVESELVPLSQREPLYHKILELAQESASKSEGLTKEYAQNTYLDWQVRWIRYLLKTKQFERAKSELEALPKDTAPSVIAPLSLQIAARLNMLDKVLDAYRADPEHAPSLEVLRDAAKQLRETGDKNSARKVLELVFTREIESHQLTAANMLGLAEIRIEAGDLQGAMELLRRMTLVVGSPFANQDAAAALLMKTGHAAEATSFLEELAHAVPWNGSYRIRLAQAKIAAGKDVEQARDALAEIAGDKQAGYALRSTAAAALTGSRPNVNFDSNELKLLSQSSAISEAAANKPFYYAARIKAAETSASTATRLALLRAVIEDRPFADAARPLLFRAALDNARYHVAVATVEPLTYEGLSATLQVQSVEQDEADLNDEDRWYDRSGNNLARIPVKQRSEIASGLGLAFEKLDELQLAVNHFRSAYKLETDPAKKSVINTKVQSLRAVLRRRSANAARQPSVHEALEQDRIVHPRLVARAAVVSAPKSVARKAVTR